MTTAEKIYHAIGEGYGFNGSKEEAVKVIEDIILCKDIDTGACVKRKLPKDCISEEDGVCVYPIGTCEQCAFAHKYPKFNFDKYQ